MRRVGGRSRCSTTGNQVVCRRTPAVLQDADRLIQGSPPYRVHDRGATQVRVGQDSEASFTGETLGRPIQASVMRRPPEEGFEARSGSRTLRRASLFKMTNKWRHWRSY